jgi:hypothetical protein
MTKVPELDVFSEEEDINRARKSSSGVTVRVMLPESGSSPVTTDQ